MRLIAFDFALARRGFVAAVLVALSGLLWVRPVAAQIITPADFGPSAVTDTFTGLGLPVNNFGSLVRPEGVYTDDNGIIRYNDFANDSFGQAIGNDTDTGTINLALNAPAFRVGLFIGSSPADVSFFDSSNNLLQLISVTGNSLAPVFAGFQSSSLVSRILVQDTLANSRIVVIDNVTTEAAAPEPGSIALAAFGALPLLAGMRFRRRRHRAE